ncbi:LutC/YkgG family protein [Leeia oryzae]|uniref:LutC/YkgG family protein n=1 Tax=Leeia oryzae TaxID=356662 RepID=UPI000363E88C|nr:lactate utilization protein C [Leeia oryzae]
MSARDNILGKLKAAPVTPVIEPDTAAHFARFASTASKLELLKHWAAAMRSVKTEIIWVTESNWADKLAARVTATNLPDLLVSDTPHGTKARAALANSDVTVKVFDRPVDEWKESLFNDVSASLTRCLCGIAQTGTLVLWPDSKEPRTMSLVPPVHFVLFDTQTLYPNFFTAMDAQQWSAGMPTNAVLVSGPSKTADIQLTLAYGAHGPREVIVLACLPEGVNPTLLEDAA